MLVVALIVIAASVALAIGLSRRSKLRRLPDESRERHARSWHRWLRANFDAEPVAGCARLARFPPGAAARIV